jgi:hypothetical protein
MKRRKFTQSLFATAGFSSLPICVSFAANAPLHELQKSKVVYTVEGLNLLLKKQVNPMKNKDRKQFILTYEVDNNKKPLEEKIYDVIITGGKSHQIYMTPVADDQLQAVFNWRLNA